MKSLSQKLKKIFTQIKQRLTKKTSGQKRKILGSGILAGSLIFGSLKTGSNKTHNHETITILAHERVVSNQELNLFNEDNRQVILAGIGDKSNRPPTQGPSNSPVSPPRGRGSSHPPTGVNPYITAPKVVGYGLGANPTGAGGGGGNAEFDDTCPAPQKQKLDKINSEHPSFYSTQSRKKQSSEQCKSEEQSKPVVEIVDRIKGNPSLVREEKRANRDQDAKRAIDNLVEQLSKGNKNPGIGNKRLFKNVFEARGKNRARVYFREVDGKIEILGKSVKRNQGKVISILEEMYK